jgi:hypothetical protein
MKATALWSRFENDCWSAIANVWKYICKLELIQ